MKYITNKILEIKSFAATLQNVVPYEIIQLKYLVSRIIVVAARLVNGLSGWDGPVISAIGEWDGPTSSSVPLLNGPGRIAERVRTLNPCPPTINVTRCQPDYVTWLLAVTAAQPGSQAGVFLQAVDKSHKNSLNIRPSIRSSQLLRIVLTKDKKHFEYRYPHSSFTFFTRVVQSVPSGSLEPLLLLCSGARVNVY